MATYEDILKKLQGGKTVYLLNEFYSTVIKVIPGTTNYKAKYKGGREYSIDRKTDLVCETFEEPVEITAEEYENY